eukprot:805900_1
MENKQELELASHNQNTTHKSEQKDDSSLISKLLDIDSMGSPKVTKHDDGNKAITLFQDSNPTTTRKVFVSFHIITISIGVDTESFRTKFYIFLNWLPTESEYKSWYESSKEAEKRNDPSILAQWKPKWSPKIVFPNMTEEHSAFQEEKMFTMHRFSDFGPQNELCSTRATFIRTKLEGDMTFYQSFALDNFPLDCQNLTCIIEEKSPNTNSLDEWDVHTYLVEFMQKPPEIIILIKLCRRFKVYLWSDILFMLLVQLLAFGAFLLDNMNDAFSYTLTLFLAVALYAPKTPTLCYLTIMDRYHIACFLYLCFVMVILMFDHNPHLFGTETADPIVWVVCTVLVFLVLNIYFILQARRLRSWERRKLWMNYEQLDMYVEECKHLFRLRWDDGSGSPYDGRDGARNGINFRDIDPLFDTEIRTNRCCARKSYKRRIINWCFVFVVRTSFYFKF